jgi:hypothetical protein
VTSKKDAVKMLVEAHSVLKKRDQGPLVALIAFL